MLLFVAGASNQAPADEPAGVPTRVRMEQWWTDLEKPEPDASRALLRFADQPEESVRFFQDKLRPLKISEPKLNELLDRLASNERQVWEAAFEELEYLDPRLAVELELLMEQVDAAPARQRLVALLSSRPVEALEGLEVTLRPVGDDGYNFKAGGSWWAEHKVERLNVGYSNPKKKWTRAVRALMLLEHMGTPEAVAILEQMATGHPEAQPTRVAREALERVGAREAE